MPGRKSDNGRGTLHAAPAAARTDGPDVEEMLTARDVARQLRMHVITVYRLAEQGKIPGFKVGRQWRFSRQVIAEWARHGHAPENRPALAVTDDKDVLQVLAGCLPPEGFEITQAGNLEHALTEARAGDYQLLFVDLLTPGLRRPGALQELLGRCRDAYVIVATDRPTEPAVAEAAAAGPVTILRHPIKPASLQGALGRMGDGGRR